MESNAPNNNVDRFASDPKDPPKRTRQSKDMDNMCIACTENNAARVANDDDTAGGDVVCFKMNPSYRMCWLCTTLNEPCENYPPDTSDMVEYAANSRKSVYDLRLEGTVEEAAVMLEAKKLAAYRQSVLDGQVREFGTASTTKSVKRRRLDDSGNGARHGEDMVELLKQIAAGMVKSNQEGEEMVEVVKQLSASVTKMSQQGEEMVAILKQLTVNVAKTNIVLQTIVDQGALAADAYHAGATDTAGGGAR